MRRLVVLLVLAGALCAQVPDGWYVVSSFNNASRGPGGLSFVHPRTPQNPIAVTGLGTDLTGASSTQGGANCVTFDPATGLLLVGELDQNGTTIDLHEIVVNGRARRRPSTRCPCRTAAPIAWSRGTTAPRATRSMRTARS